MIYVRIFAFFIFLVLSAQAKLQLVEWHSDNWSRPFLLPVKDRETPQQAAARYLKLIDKTSELAELLWEKKIDLEASRFYPLKATGSKVLLLANRAQDYTQNSERVNNLSKILAKTNRSTYLLPVAIAGILGVQEKQEFYDLITDKFPVAFALGGDDVDPKYYKSENFHSHPQSSVRDQYEISFIQNYYRRGKGFIFGICRGAQLTAIALGYKLIQDIPFQISNPISHQNDYHSLVFNPTKNQILSEAVGLNRNVSVKSIHHQAVQFHQNGPLEIAALSQDGVVEALEDKGGKALLVQFHPELMTEPIGEKIILKALDQPKTNQRRICFKFYGSKLGL